MPEEIPWNSSLYPEKSSTAPFRPSGGASGWRQPQARWRSPAEQTRPGGISRIPTGPLFTRRARTQPGYPPEYSSRLYLPFSPAQSAQSGARPARPLYRPGPPAQPPIHNQQPPPPQMAPRFEQDPGQSHQAQRPIGEQPRPTIPYRAYRPSGEQARPIMPQVHRPASGANRSLASAQGGPQSTRFERRERPVPRNLPPAGNTPPARSAERPGSWPSPVLEHALPQTNGSLPAIQHIPTRPVRNQEAKSLQETSPSVPGSSTRRNTSAELPALSPNMLSSASWERHTGPLRPGTRVPRPSMLPGPASMLPSTPRATPAFQPGQPAANPPTLTYLSYANRRGRISELLLLFVPTGLLLLSIVILVLAVTLKWL